MMAAFCQHRSPAQRAQIPRGPAPALLRAARLSRAGPGAAHAHSPVHMDVHAHTQACNRHSGSASAGKKASRSKKAEGRTRAGGRPLAGRAGDARAWKHLEMQRCFARA